jgi:hypothetical protein
VHCNWKARNSMDYEILPSIAGTYLRGSRCSAYVNYITFCAFSWNVCCHDTSFKFKHFQVMVLFQKFSTRISIEETSHNQQPATHCSNSSHWFTVYYFQHLITQRIRAPSSWFLHITRTSEHEWKVKFLLSIFRSLLRPRPSPHIKKITIN